MPIPHPCTMEVKFELQWTRKQWGCQLLQKTWLLKLLLWWMKRTSCKLLELPDCNCSHCLSSLPRCHQRTIFQEIPKMPWLVLEWCDGATTCIIIIQKESKMNSYLQNWIREISQKYFMMDRFNSFKYIAFGVGS